MLNYRTAFISIMSATYSAVDTVEFVRRQYHDIRQVSDSYARYNRRSVIIVCINSKIFNELAYI